ncbi:MAG: YaiI/YqxD family protein [Pirellulaceae bacterium]
MRKTSAIQIWVDADACPGEIKEILFRVAQRREIQVTLVANQSLRTPASPWIDTLLVPGGMNIADRKIVELVAAGDLVITADIPLAADVVNKGAQALDPRGVLYTDANVGERLGTRDLFDKMRGAGQIVGGPSNFTSCNRQAFANQLDRWLAKVKRQ